MATRSIMLDKKESSCFLDLCGINYQAKRGSE